MNIKLTFSLFLILNVLTINGQSYHVQSFQDTYVEIDDYKSLMKELEGDFFWYHTFNLGFEFPFFDLKYNYINGSYRGIFGFDDELDYSMNLLAFGYHPDNLLDTINLISDVRYNLKEISGRKCLVVQYTKNRLTSDPSVEEFDSYVNFQYWFFEDGTIELRFGKANLANSPVYIPGDGFYLLTNQGPIPVGPFLGLTHPLEINKIINYNDIDSFQRFELLDNWIDGNVNWWPPEGWVIRFTNLLVSTNEKAIDFQTKVFPNPTNDKIMISSESPIREVKMFCVNGMEKISHKGDGISEINMTGLPPGTYFLRLFDGEYFHYHKIVKL